MKKYNRKIKVQYQVGERYLRGGLGDAYWYIFHDPVISRLDDILIQHPELKLEIIHYTHTPNSSQLFERPGVSVKSIYVKEDKNDIYIKNPLQNYINDIKTYKKGYTIHLTDSDKEQIEELIDNKQFVMVHFQAGSDDREVFSPKEQNYVIDKLKEKHSFIYFIGTRSELNLPFINKVIDLRGKTNPRVIYFLTQHSEHIYCYHSFMLLLSGYLNKNVTCYYPAYHIEIEKERKQFEKFFDISLSSSNITLTPISGCLSNAKTVSNIGNNRFILSYGASPVGYTGMGRLSKEILCRASDHGFNVQHVGTGYQPLVSTAGVQLPNPLPISLIEASFESPTLKKAGVPHDLRGRHLYMHSVASRNPDIAWINEDLFRFFEVGFRQFIEHLKEKNNKTKTIVYFPVDSEYYSKDWLNIIEKVDYPITYTNWSYNKAIELKPELRDKLKVIPHGMDFNKLYNYEDKNYINKIKEEKIGSVDKFVFLTVAENQARKDFSTQLIAYKQFLDSLSQKEAENIVMLIICQKKSAYGWHIDNLIKRIGINPERVLIPSHFPLSDKDLRDSYNIADCGVTASFAEGWGYFVTECMATKKPVIAGKHTTNNEFIKDKENGLFVELEDNYTYLHGMIDDPPRHRLDVKDLCNQMLNAYNMSPEEREKMGENGYESVKHYDWNIVWEKWRELFDFI